LGRIIRNFIDNAIKYTEHGSVTIKETQTDEDLNISVIDTGIGISEHEQDKIFDEYHQIGNQKRNRNEGIGLGLSIVKRMADLLDHEISMSSETGHGSVFTVTVPISASVLDEEAPQILDVKAVYGTQVLVIDDDTEILAAMTDVLEGWSCDVATAESLEQAINQIEQMQPDIILCDYRLHDSINGIDVLDQLYSRFSLEIPSLIVSGDNSTELNKLLESTAYHFLSKPVQPQALLGCLINVLNE
jgi:CheY-like chemotaxis protein